MMLFSVFLPCSIPRMASPQAQAEYLEDAQFVIDELTEFGQLQSFGVLQQSATPTGPTGGYVESGKANVLQLDFDAEFSTDVREDDQFFFCDNLVDLDQITHTQMNTGEVYQLCEVKRFQPDDITVIFYEIQVRRAGYESGIVL